MPNIKYTLIFLLSISFWSCDRTAPDRLVIATAANMQYAMTDLVEAFESRHHIACEVILGSSGKLTAQIKEGAPYHLFVSADARYPAVLQEEGLTVGAPVLYGYGQLILWTMNGAMEPNLDMMVSDDIRHIAIANPKTAPYGVAAMEVLQSSDIGDLSISSKLVYGESIAQVNQFILLGAADMGITAKSVVMSDRVRGKGAWVDIDPGLYKDLPQSAAILKSDDLFQKRAKTFMTFLASAEARQILTRFGYRVP